jgi:protein TonB
MILPIISYSQNPTSNGNEKVSVFSQHSLIATKEITNHLNKHIKYPQSLISSEIEGTVNLSIHIKSTGRVIKVDILEGIHPLLDKAALAALDGFKKLKEIKSPYQGSSKIIVPVTFKFD